MFLPFWLIQNVIIVSAVFPAVYVVCLPLWRKPAVQNGLWLVLLVKLILPAVFTWSIVAPSLIGSPPPKVTNNPANVPRAEIPPLEGPIEDHSVDKSIASPSPYRQDEGLSQASAGRIDYLSTGQSILELVWLTGTAVVLLLLGRRVHATRNLLNKTAAPSPGLQDAVDRFNHRTGLRIAVVTSANVDSPSVVFIGSARIVWPQTLDHENFSHDLEPLLAHEFAHAMRRDHWVKWLEYFSATIYWWNPVYWMICHQLHESREAACDALALQMTGTAPQQYANRLLELVTGINQSRSSKPACALSVSSHRSMERRLKMIFESNISGRLSRLSIVAILPFALALMPTWGLVEQKQAIAAEAVEQADVAAPTDDQTIEKKDDDAKKLSDSKADQPVAKAEKPKPVWAHGMLIVFGNELAMKEIGMEKETPEYNRLREIWSQFGPEFQRRDRNPTDEDREQKLTDSDLWGKVETEYIEKLKQAIEPQQYKRLREIFVRWQGIAVILADDFAMELKLTDEQRQTLRAIKAEFDGKVAKLQTEKRNLRDAKENTDDVDKKIEEQKPLRLAKYESVLTDEQRIRFEELKGTPFEWKDNPQRPLPVNRNPGLPIRITLAELSQMALRPPVLAELGIAADSDLAAEIRKLLDAEINEHKQRSTELRSDAQVAFDPYKRSEVLAQKYHPLLEKLLTTDKFMRVKQIRWQLRGMKSVDEDAEMSKALEMTEDQKKKLQELRLAHFQKSRQLLNPPGGRIVGTQITDEQTAKAYELLDEWELNARKVFDESQRETFQKLTGKPFDLVKLRSPPQRN